MNVTAILWPKISHSDAPKNTVRVVIITRSILKKSFFFNAFGKNEGNLIISQSMSFSTINFKLGRLTVSEGG